ncbi:glycosyltransferase [Paeniroseomonas aquatica]|uniref:glycosyltransferase n=1 Tax=Paeniroseomonas aquatica TaxID=373043 RepID=UPI00360C0B9A
MLFKHILATRFNLAFHSLAKDKNDQKTRDSEWMEHRINLFSKFCARSVSSQHNKDFVWLILIDQNTEQHWEDKIKKSIGGEINTIILRCGPYPSWGVIIRSIVSDGEFYTMTRLDNDDSISRNFIDAVQKRVPDLIRNFSKGVVGLDFSDGVEFDGSQFYPLTQPGSNFSSILARLEFDEIPGQFTIILIVTLSILFLPP